MSQMTKEEYEAFKQSLKESQEKTARMLERIDQTLAGVRGTLEQIKENSDNIDRFQKSYNEVMTAMVHKLAASFVDPLKRVPGQTYEHLPTSPPTKQLLASILKQPRLAIVTGAGVSAPSGIPTFRGQGGLYAKLFEWEGQSYRPEEFITAAFFGKHPEAIWAWVEEIYQLAVRCKPSGLHVLLDRLACALAVRGQEVTLVTQNVDDLHLAPQPHTYHYFPIHGNVKLVRCNNLHLAPYSTFRADILAGRVAKCPECGQALRPHVLFFDESYGPLYGAEVKERSFPLVMLVGTSLSTGLCTSLARQAAEIVELNPEPVVEVGRVYQYTNVQAILEELLRQLGEAK